MSEVNQIEKFPKFPLVLDLQTFADDGDGDDGNGNTPDNNTGDNGGSDDGKGGDGQNQDNVLTLSQEELDRIIADRLARQQKKFADYDDLKTKLSEYEQAEEERKKAAMSEQERIEAEKAEALEKAQKAEEKSADALKRANERLIRAEFRLLAKDAGIRADALDDAFKLADFTDVEVGEDGEVTGVDTVVNALKESKPFLVEVAVPKKPKNIGEGSNHDGGDDDEIKVLEQQLDDAKKKKNVSEVIRLSNKLKEKLRGVK